MPSPMMRSAATPALAALAGLLLARPESATAACSGGKCNAPSSYTAMSIDPDGSPPEYAKSASFDATWEAGIVDAVDTVRLFLGSSTGNRVFLYSPNEASNSNYDAVNTAWCSYTGRASDDSCPAEQTDAASPFQYPSYMVSGRQPACTCGDYTNEVAPILFRPSPGDQVGSLWDIAAHEYTHVMQKAFGGPMPAWLMEGGAVHMSCMMASIRPAAYGGPQDYSECFRTGGGRSPGIIPNVRAIYGRSDATNWLTLYGADRKCGDEAVAPYEANNPLPTDDAFRQGDYVYYDTGALAVAFAIHRSGKTSSDFWRGTSAEEAGAGFWHQVVPWGDVDYSNGWESDVPEGQGWRKALADFAGFPSAAAFYAAFEEFVRPGGTGLVTEAQILAILESDASIAAQAAVKASFAPRGPLTSCDGAMDGLFPLESSTTSNEPSTGSTTGGNTGGNDGDIDGYSSSGAAVPRGAVLVITAVAAAAAAAQPPY